jgi:hypothetical protein
MIYRFNYAVPKYRGCLHPTLRWHSVLFIDLCDFAFSYCVDMTVDALRGGIQVCTVLAFTAMCELRSPVNVQIFIHTLFFSRTIV